MDVLGNLVDGNEVQSCLGSLPKQYRQWIDVQRQHLNALSPKRMEIAQDLLNAGRNRSQAH